MTDPCNKASPHDKMAIDVVELDGIASAILS
jgi:hypothetical protein